MFHSIIIIIQPKGNIGHHPHDGRAANNNNFTTTNHAATPTLLPLTIATGAGCANQKHSHQQSGSRLMKLRHHFSSHQSERVLLSHCSSELSELLQHCVLFACRVYSNTSRKVTFPPNNPARPGLAINSRTQRNIRDGDPLLAISFRLTPTLFFFYLARTAT